MAKTKGLSIPDIKGGIPSNPKELKGFTDKLQVSIDLARTALKQKGIEPAKYKEILRQGQEWAELKLRAELNLKSYIETIPKNAGGYKSKKDITIHFKKNKTEKVKELGLTEIQYKQIRKLTIEGVELAIEKSREEGDIPTRYAAIKKWGKLETDHKNVNPKILYSEQRNAISRARLFDEIGLKKPSMSIKVESDFKISYGYELNFDNTTQGLIQISQFENYILKNFHEYIPVHSPLNYVGSKEKLKNRILPYLKDKETIVSPFLGGGTLELNLANMGHNVIAYDDEPNIFNFWTQMWKNPELLRQTINVIVQERILHTKTGDYKKTYEKMHNDYKNGLITDDMEKAAIYWILSLTGFGGILQHGNAGKDFFHHVNREYIYNKIMPFKWFFDDGKFQVSKMSFEKSIPKHPDDFLYCDPPYATEHNDIPVDNTYYGFEKKYSKIDHEELAKLLKGRKNWILSYNDCDYIQKLYKGHDMEFFEEIYSIGNKRGEETKISKELLIFG